MTAADEKALIAGGDGTRTFFSYFTYVLMTWRNRSVDGDPEFVRISIMTELICFFLFFQESRLLMYLRQEVDMRQNSVSGLVTHLFKFLQEQSQVFKALNVHTFVRTGRHVSLFLGPSSSDSPWFTYAAQFLPVSSVDNTVPVFQTVLECESILLFSFLKTYGDFFPTIHLTLLACRALKESLLFFNYMLHVSQKSHLKFFNHA
jgi:hypothetical protein